MEEPHTCTHAQIGHHRRPDHAQAVVNDVFAGAAVVSGLVERARRVCELDGLEVKEVAHLHVLAL